MSVYNYMLVSTLNSHTRIVATNHTHNSMYNNQPLLLILTVCIISVFWFHSIAFN